jgi:hypothetical protein
MVLKSPSSEGEAFPVSIFRHLGDETIVVWWQCFGSISFLYFMAPWYLFMAFSSIINRPHDGIYIFHPYMNFGMKFQQIGIILSPISAKNYLFINIRQS